MTEVPSSESWVGRFVGALRDRGARDGANDARRPRPRPRPAKAPVKRMPAPPAQQAMSMALALLSAVLLTLVVNLVAISQVQHVTSQAQLYKELRLQLAEGATPVGPMDSAGHVTPLGTPVAMMSAPEIGLAHEVIVNGTTSAQTMDGVGYRRDTVLPCQAGSSVLMARSGGYGGVGERWVQLQNGDRFTVTMGEGRCTYQVVDHRLAGQKAPTPPSGKQGALTLVTATGYPFVPTGVVRIDATLVGKSYAAANVTIPTGALPTSELPLGSDQQQLFPLTMLLEALVALALVATWLWRRWSPVKTFVVAIPVALALVLLTAQNVDLLLPNLL
ncbi:hypothetical protein ACFOYW_15915 [Gryllotalpicola reticulitermitis]|uniref:Sortase n=1 Tax=Gryllotalpicola reticulitermitis TaxID=1184153 RepID=A0ABV8Q950_9MICO